MSDREMFAQWVRSEWTETPEDWDADAIVVAFKVHWVTWLAATEAERESCVTRAAAALESTGLNPPQRHYVLAAIRDKETE